MEMYSAPPEVWRVLRDTQFAKDRGEKQVTLDVSDLEFLFGYQDEITELESQIQRLGDEIDDKDSEINRYMDDLNDADEKITYFKNKIDDLKRAANDMYYIAKGIDL